MDLLKSLGHLDEIYALLRFRFGGRETTMPKSDYESLSPTLQKCYDYLNKTSRSFAAVIQALEGDLRHAVCIFYLVLRALDTIEDDTTIPLYVKIPIMKDFHKNLYMETWRYLDSKEKDRIVVEDFPTISREFRELAPMYQDVIHNITKKMGDGMTVFLSKGVDSYAEWNEYCHYVAGLVGIGLSRLFSASGLEDKSVGQDKDLANNMGLFLQKTNIIRDYLEDQLERREFWPKEAWSKHGEALADFQTEENIPAGMDCLNELVTNTLQQIPDLMKYMSSLKNRSIFNFCAIPQVMAIGTLERCYNNPLVFKGVVKIRKGEAVRMMMEATSLENVKSIFSHFIELIQRRIPADDPNAELTRSYCGKALEVTRTEQSYITSSIYPPLYVSCFMLVSAMVWQYWSQIGTLYTLFTASQDNSEAS